MPPTEMPPTGAQPEPPPGARRVTVAGARLPGWLDGFGTRHGGVGTRTGERYVELTGADGARAWVRIPFGPLIGTLTEHVARTRRIGVVLARRGGHAAGLFEGRTLLASKVGSSYVQGTTKAGGWSQQRYARRRANQATAAFAGAADAVTRVLGDVTDLDAVVTGGDREAVRAVLSDRRLAHLEPLVTDPWLTVKDPKLRVLAVMPEQFLAVNVHLDP